MASWTYIVQPNDNARLTRVRTLCDFPLRLSRRESYRGGQQTLLPNVSFVFKYGLKVINLSFVVSLSRAPAITAFYELLVQYVCDMVTSLRRPYDIRW